MLHKWFDGVMVQAAYRADDMPASIDDAVNLPGKAMKAQVRQVPVNGRVFTEGIIPGSATAVSVKGKFSVAYVPDLSVVDYGKEKVGVVTYDKVRPQLVREFVPLISFADAPDFLMHVPVDVPSAVADALKGNRLFPDKTAAATVGDDFLLGWAATKGNTGLWQASTGWVGEGDHFYIKDGDYWSRANSYGAEKKIEPGAVTYTIKIPANLEDLLRGVLLDVDNGLQSDSTQPHRNVHVWEANDGAPSLRDANNRTTLRLPCSLSQLLYALPKIGVGDKSLGRRVYVDSAQATIYYTEEAI